MSTYRGFVSSERKDSLSESMMYSYDHQTGFHITLIKKPGFVRKFAAFSIPYGSADLRFMEKDDFARNESARKKGDSAGSAETAAIEVPPGSAHYLEHCIFSRDDEGGLMGQLSRFGAQANAYTSDAETTYYFTCVDHFGDSLLLYFDALCHPSIDEERIRAEREIIGAELDMYEDDPDSVAIKTLLGQMYARHGLQHDIGGTRDSIRKINLSHLDAICRSFYTPSAMNLVMVGDFDDQAAGKVIDLLADRLDSMTVRPKGVCLSPDEPAAVEEPHRELMLDVENESFMIGFKNAAINGRNKMYGTQWALIQAAGQLYCDALIGETTPIYQELYDLGIINDSFQVQFTCGLDYNYIMMSGESSDPEMAAQEVARRFRAGAAGDQLDRHLFSVQMKAFHGSFIRSLDHIEACGMAAVEARQFGCDLFDHTAVFKRLNAEEAANMVRFVLDERSMAQLILRKRGI